ncbi:MAG: metal-dependent hydrolase [Planctomycetes bacterium]|nr:metal-dependent hydrolase [Planctomycetota bacterium]MBL7008058.1 metal-dependent hydrolase [Planctomycetota bacterium]
MASAFAHAFVAIALAPGLAPRLRRKRVVQLGAACSILPDLDVLGFELGIPYGHPLGHRGLTHAPFFAAALAVVLVAALFRHPRWREARPLLFLYLFICTASHGLLDAMTDGGLGVAFLLPFDAGRYFLPWTPVEVSPLSAGAFFSARGLVILGSEAVWIGLPAALLGALLLFLRRRFAPPRSGGLEGGG